ncbi:MAG: integration host factor subunit beta [Pedosphaera sp.]|nr:integration host factor subunit beta [Pedosphaera sp.]
MSITKREIVLEIARKLTEPPVDGNLPPVKLTQLEIMTVVQATLDTITAALAKGEKVELREFGVFKVVTRKARVGRNPKQPKINVPIPDRSVVKFKSGKIMRAEVLKLPPRKEVG